MATTATTEPATAPPIQKLTPKRARFVEEYLVDLNATAAAIRAGYSSNGADVQGVRLLGNASVQAAITEKRESFSKSMSATVERVLREYCRLAFLDIRKAYNADGSLKPVHEIDDDTAAAIAGLEIEEETDLGDDGTATRTTTKKVKFADKRGALDSLAKHLGLFKDGNTQQNLIAFKVYLGFNPDEV